MHNQDLNNMKPSALLRLALSDLRKVEQDPRYKVNMERWHYPDADGCNVCLAGAVLAMTQERSLHSSLEGVAPHWARRLDALRCGGLYFTLGDDLPDSLRGREEIPKYDEDPIEFHNQLQGVAYLLERGGL